jgi:hypothetical protein
MAKSSKKSEAVEQIIAIQRLERATTTMYLLGTSALIMNRMAAKAKQQLLYPDRKLNKAEREARIKHNPPEEYRDSVYRCRDDKAPTYVHAPNGALKKAMAQAAIDTPGATKAETGRLVKILDDTVHVYGKPFLFMAVVRQAGPAKTPDIRTRAIFPQWCLKVSIQYIRQKIREQDIVNLIANAGDITGIGDGRTEKGTFDFGGWEIVHADDPRWREIAKTGGRSVQLHAMQNPECFDEDTEELLSWYQSEIIRREVDKKPKAPIETVVAASKQKANGGKRRKEPNT